MDKQDKKILENLIKKYEGEKKSVFTRKWFNLVLWLIITFSIFALLQFRVTSTVLIVVSAFIGALVMLSFMIQSGETTWRIMKPFINIQQAKEKLENT